MRLSVELKEQEQEMELEQEHGQEQELNLYCKLAELQRLDHIFHHSDTGGSDRMDAILLI